MAALDLAAVMDAIAEALGDITGLRVFAYPPDSLVPPAAIVGYPDQDIEFDYTFGRASDRASFPVWAVVGKPYDRAARDELAPFIGGAREIKDALDGNLGGAVSSCRVTGARVEVIAVGSIDYLAVRFDLDIVT